ncbi:hypothetical protein [Rhodococcus daqingensis]|uniref:Uncharacterized protein n=1 Tax=Rhodococcus daqingensis TaxID=2479363 RepID=A0ABW2S2X8_9NOCA
MNAYEYWQWLKLHLLSAEMLWMYATGGTFGAAFYFAAGGA